MNRALDPAGGTKAKGLDEMMVGMDMAEITGDRTVMASCLHDIATGARAVCPRHRLNSASYSIRGSMIL
jgi:hypothetical protein